MKSTQKNCFFFFFFNTRKQVHGFMKYFSFSFLWALFQWFYSGGDKCGFSQFPTFGLKAWKNSWVLNILPLCVFFLRTWNWFFSLKLTAQVFCRFYFDFSLTYIGAGMICSHIVNLSLLLGAILSWGIMWPLMEELKGEWYPGSLPQSSMKSLNGYKVRSRKWGVSLTSWTSLLKSMLNYFSCSLVWYRCLYQLL